MTQYNISTLKLPNFQFNKLKFVIKSCAEVTLKLSSNAVGNSIDDTNFPNKLLLSSIHVSSFVKPFQMVYLLI